MNGDDFEDEQVADPGGVPKTLTPRVVVPGYRGMNRLPAIALLGIIVLCTAIGLFALAQRRTGVAVAAQTTLQPNADQTENPLPDPTATPFVRVTPRRTFIQPQATAPAAQPAAPIVPEETAQNAVTAASTAAPTKTPAETESEERAALITAAAHASGRMSLAAADDAAAKAAGVDSVSSNSSPVASGPSSGVGYDKPTSPYEINETTMIAARLMTAVDSTLPGLIKAQVTTPVYDSRTHSVVVIPAGAILIGQYDSATNAGEARLLASWTRILFPDGTKFTMGPNQGSGAKGEAGMAVSVDTHAGRAFGNALLYTLLDAAGNVLSSSVNGSRQIISVNTATQTVQPPKQQGPTFHLYPGSLFNVLVARDLPLAEYRPQ